MLEGGNYLSDHSPWFPVFPSRRTVKPVLFAKGTREQVDIVTPSTSTPPMPRRSSRHDIHLVAVADGDRLRRITFEHLCGVRKAAGSGFERSVVSSPTTCGEKTAHAERSRASHARPSRDCSSPRRCGTRETAHQERREVLVGARDRLRMDELFAPRDARLDGNAERGEGIAQALPGPVVCRRVLLLPAQDRPARIGDGLPRSPRVARSADRSGPARSARCRRASCQCRMRARGWRAGSE